MRFPLYKNDGQSACRLSQVQKKTLQVVKDKIESGVYRQVKNKCLCQNQNAELDTVFSEKDRYGFAIQSIICSKCGLIRSSMIFDLESNLAFYSDEYRSLYCGTPVSSESFFSDQVSRGENLFRLCQGKIPLSPKMSVFEVGCGAGGILLPFYDAGMVCSGSDYDENYLEFGRSKGMDLRWGDYQDLVEDNTVDILILSHVMEHFTNPVLELQKILHKVSPNGFVLVEVPGVFNIDRVYFSPIFFLQNAHVFSFYGSYLRVFFEMLGLEILYGDEACSFVLKKPVDWQEHNLSIVFSPSLTKYPALIKRYIKATAVKDWLWINPYKWRSRVGPLLGRLGLKTQTHTLLKPLRKILRKK